MQNIAEHALADAVERARTVPQLTGEREIKTVRADAAANYPYDPQVWGGGSIDAKAYEQLQKNPGKPLFSQAIQGGYAPGSTFKVITTAAARSAPRLTRCQARTSALPFTRWATNLHEFRGGHSAVGLPERGQPTH